MSDDKRSQILDKVRKLLALADNEAATPAEAERARTKAEQLMRDYQIEEEALLAEDPQAMTPEMMLLELFPQADEFVNVKYWLLGAVARHVGVRYRLISVDRMWAVQVVGYATDIKFAELLYTQAALTFSEHLQPDVKPNLSDAENAYRLRSAGIPRNRVANLIWGASMGSDGAPAHGKVGKLYKEECARRGETVALDGRGVNAGTYRAAYANSFYTRFSRRLDDARDGADRATGAIQLHSRKERVDEAFYQQFPEMRPSTEVAEVEECGDCIKTKHASGKCSSHRYRPPTKADIDRHERANYSAAALAGKDAGRSAAEKVALDGRNAQRLDSYTADERQAVRAVKALGG